MVVAKEPQRGAVARGAVLLLLVAAAGACDSEESQSSAAPNQRTQGEKTVADKPEPGAAETKAGAVQSATPTPIVLSHAQVFAIILKPSLLDMKLDQLSERFAPVEFERQEPMYDMLAVAAKSESQPGALRLVFRRKPAVADSKGGKNAKHNEAGDDKRLWYFAYLRYQVAAASGAVAKRLYDEFVGRTRQALGKPTSITEQSPYLARSFKLANRFNVTVGAILNQDEGQPYAAIVIEEPPPP